VTPADEFRAEARQKTGDVVFKVIGGWAFGLSYGPVKLETAINAAEDAGLRIATEEKGDVTDKVLERLRNADEKDVEPIMNEWLLSAKLYPHNRSSTEADWRFLGTMLAALHVPLESIVTPIEQTDPNSTHYWSWSEGDK
jgi:hypothetical protein